MAFEQLTPHIKYEDRGNFAIVTIAPGAVVQVKKGAEMFTRLNPPHREEPRKPVEPVKVELLGEAKLQGGGTKFAVSENGQTYYVEKTAIELLEEDNAKLCDVSVIEIRAARAEQEEDA